MDQDRMALNKKFLAFKMFEPACHGTIKVFEVIEYFPQAISH
jgi:hypothetical protein